MLCTSIVTHGLIDIMDEFDCAINMSYSRMLLIYYIMLFNQKFLVCCVNVSYVNSFGS